MLDKINQQSFNYLIILYFVLFLISFIISGVLYFLKAFGIYKMSQKLDIKNPWFAFVPFLNVLALGRVSEYSRDNPSKNGIFSKLLLFVYSIIVIGAVITIGMSLLAISKVLFAADAAYLAGSDIISNGAFSGFKTVFSVLVGILAVYIVYNVLTFVALYRIYNVFANKSSILYLVLSIIFPILIPIFIFTISKKEPRQLYINFTLE